MSVVELCALASTMIAALLPPGYNCSSREFVFHVEELVDVRGAQITIQGPKPLDCWMRTYYAGESRSPETIASDMLVMAGLERESWTVIRNSLSD